jgi:calcineurin-like phosphoesterase family protein
MKVWAKSHYNSWQLFGHSHGKLEGVGKQMDIGVDTHNFYPYSLDEIRTIMKTKPDNSNLLCT